LSSVIKVDKIQSDTGTVNVASKIEFPAGTVSAPSIFPTGDTNTGIFFPAADTIAFAEGGAEAMRIDSSGNLGIGTTTPSSFYSLADNLVLGTGSGGHGLTIYSGSGDSGYIGFNDTVTNSMQGFIQYNHSGDYMAFAPNGAERMRIDSSGNVFVGATSGNAKLVVDSDSLTLPVFRVNSTGSSAHQRCVSAQMPNRAPNDTTSYFFNGGDSSATRAVIYSNGGLANFSGNNVNLSDRREKINFAPAKNYLDVICNIPVQTFNYIDQSDDDPGLTLGVVAQDVQEVAPEFVMESNWGTEEEPKMRLSIYQTDLQYALMKCIQELKAELDEAKARIAALETQE